MSGAVLLEGRGVTKSFGGLHVLRDVSFAVSEGEIVALVGPNGAGKTTLFNLISGLLRPSAGSIRLADRELTTLPPYQICRLGVGRTFQTPRPFLDTSVRENVATAALFAHHRGGRDDDLLRLVDLADQADVIARHLPAPRRKLLDLAMALASAPRIILLDEILGGLTPAEAGRFIEILKTIRDERGITLFWIDHVMWAVMETAERVIVIHHGEVICEGDPASVARDARVLSAYLG
ncbi:MAG: ABC transporter ATP-binding protein [Candidatus Rokuibacteriota bacterium]|nr:MAG: ABC transporter ATP-binding protein [Candidatus Rokubacteria bacterium]